MRILSGRAASAQVKQIAERRSHFEAVEAPVRRIVNDVKSRGDRALRKYSQQWDGLGVSDSFRVAEKEIDTAWQVAPAQLRSSLRQAATNIRRFCQRQKPKAWRQTTSGIALGQLVRPLGSVGCYVPGGRYPLVSTLLMTVIPAQVAGIKNIRVVSPRPRPEVLAAAKMLGITEFYRIGGAQAIAALAYGTESIPRVDKIVGPGNSYVTAAKKLVSFDCAIDMLAGPTEVLILSEKGNPAFIAADLVAQAEHDPKALAVFITTSPILATVVAAAVKTAAANNKLARKALTAHGVVLVSESKQQSRDWANQIASEHITVSPDDVDFIHNAGSIFVGDYSAQAGGDYGVGPNHVLPTAGGARFRGGLSVLDFVKLISVQEVSRAGFRTIAPFVEQLAISEGLSAHAESIRIRTAHA